MHDESNRQTDKPATTFLTAVKKIKAGVDDLYVVLESFAKDLEPSLKSANNVPLESLKV